MPSRFSSLLLLLACAAHADQDYGLIIEEMAERGELIVQDAQRMATGSDGTSSSSDLHALDQAVSTVSGAQRLRELSGRVPSQAAPRQPPPSSVPDSGGHVVYLMTTIGELDDSLTRLHSGIALFNRENGLHDVVRAHVVIRGLAPGDVTIGNTLSKLQPIVSRFREQVPLESDPQIDVALNPNPFREFSVGDEGPVLAIVSPDGTVRRSRGSYSITETLKLSHTDIRTLGPTVALAERDLLDEIQDRIARLDVAGIKQGAQDRLWLKLGRPVRDLPLAESYRRFDVSLAFELQQPLLDAEGKVLIPAGQSFNPMDKIPFNRTIVAFNPSRQVELDRVMMFLSRIPVSARLNVRPLVTHLAFPGHDKPREAQQALERHLGMPVYLLDDTAIHRFQIVRTPTMITGDNRRRLMVVEEMAPAAKEGS